MAVRFKKKCKRSMWKKKRNKEKNERANFMTTEKLRVALWLWREMSKCRMHMICSEIVY